MAVLREKEVIQNVLQRYKELPCLWNQSHEMYSNKIARKEGLAELLEIYRLIDPNAQLHELKKKIENFRTTYKRERVKVLKSHVSDGPEYVPTLWYYNHLTFLNDGFGAGLPGSPKRRKSPEYFEEERLDEEDTESNYDLSPPQKKRKKNTELLYLAEDDHDTMDIPRANSLHEPDRESYIDQDLRKNNLEPISSAESFGKTIGLQLGELPPMQRFIAEKLISDVIFYGRLEKLQPNATLNLNSDNHSFV